jgi:hypothetical protein
LHFARSLVQHVPKAHQGMFSAALRSVFALENAKDTLAAGTIWPSRWLSASPRTMPSPVWRGRCCWSRASTGSCWAAACSPTKAWPQVRGRTIPVLLAASA